jgi:hypothetical protein
VCVVRPSMVCAVAGAPYPGYSGSLAGPGGVALSQAIGFFDTVDSVAMVPTNGESARVPIWLAVAGGLLSLVLEGQDLRRSMNRPPPTPNAVWDVVPGDQVAAAVVAAAAATASRVSVDGYSRPDGAGPGVRGAGSGGGGGGLVNGSALQEDFEGGGMLIVHATTSTTYPISFVESQW